MRSHRRCESQVGSNAQNFLLKYLERLDDPTEVDVDADSTSAFPELNTVSQRNQQPFFLKVSYHRPHSPYDPPGRFWQRATSAKTVSESKFPRGREYASRNWDARVSLYILRQYYYCIQCCILLFCYFFV